MVGEYKGKKVFIEVKGKNGCIDRKSDFRQILERKTTDSDDPDNTIALLVGNPFRLNPLELRPPKDQNLFEIKSIGIAEKINIGLVSTVEIFNILNDVLADRIEKGKILDEILNHSGQYIYKTKA